MLELRPETKNKAISVLKWIAGVGLLAGFVPYVPPPYWGGILIALFAFIVIVIIKIVIADREEDVEDDDDEESDKDKDRDD